ncbi:FtsX-like permease family protein [Solihabitans fulvus]|uniref:FtsX-like permease family protein n=2 Tax=Solihabitans fulvus TaxID=1892852 RepID=A0A5B2XTZ8_9PSEU|nr:FtsX-like permease family protein [Solihabitans fulvus]
MTVFRLGLGELRNRPGRALLPGVALVVGVACLIASLVLSDAMGRAVSDGAPRVPDQVGVVVHQTRISPAPLDQAMISRVSAADGVTRVVPVQEIRTDLVGADGRAGAKRATADVELDEAALRRVPIAEGRSPASDGEIAVDRVTAYDRGLHPGSTVRLVDAAGSPIDVAVTGVTVRGTTDKRPLLVVGPGLAAKLDPKPSTESLHVLTRPGVDPAKVLAAAGAGVTAQTTGELRASADGNPLGVLLLPFSILALATAMFVATATFRAVYLQRQRQTALLRCIGADRAPLVTGNLLEALLTGATAGLLGALFGGPVGWLLARLFDVTGLSVMLGAIQLDPPLLPSLGNVVLGVSAAAALSALAALRPALAAARVSPLAALRSAEGQTPERAVVRRRRAAGIVLVVIAGVLAALGVAARGTIAGPFLVVFSGITAVAGLFGALGPVVVPAVGRIFGGIAARIGGPLWKLAAAEVRRVPQRSAAVAMPLILASAIVTFGTVALGAMHDMAEKYDSKPRADAIVSDSGDRTLSGQAVRAAGQQPQVAASAVLHKATTTGQDGEGHQTSTVVLGVEPGQLRSLFGALGQGDATGFGAGSALLSEWKLEQLGGRVGGQVTVPDLPGGPRTLTVAGTVPADLLDYAQVVVADPGIAPASSVLVALKPGADAAAYRDTVRHALPEAPSVLVDIRADRTAELNEAMRLANVAMMVLLGLSVAVAVTGIGTALAISVQERRKELALRRALGVTRGGVHGGVVAEAVLLALVGVLAGGAFGLVYAELSIASVKAFVVPTAALLPLVVGGLVVVSLAMLSALGPARRAAAIRPAAGLASG